jgi:isocitrate dehydrogenase
LEAALNEAIAKRTSIVWSIQKRNYKPSCPSDVIVDASMPAMIRTSGQMYDKDGKQLL